MAFDAAALLASYPVALMLRYDAGSVADMAGRVATVAAIAVGLQWVAGLAFGAYTGRVAVASIEETLLLGLVTVGAGSAIGAANVLSSPPYVARTLPFTAPFMGLFVMVVGRALWRHRSEYSFVVVKTEKQPALVLGAGSSGRLLAQSMMTSDSPLWPVGFLDDDPWKRNLKHFGIPVVGTVS